MRESSQSKKATVNNEGRIVVRCARIGQRRFPRLLLVIAIRGTGSQKIGNELVECRFAFWDLQMTQNFDGDQRLFSRIASSSISSMLVGFVPEAEDSYNIYELCNSRKMIMSRSAYVICSALTFLQ